jgi:hypothetical protein
MVNEERILPSQVSVLEIPARLDHLKMPFKCSCASGEQSKMATLLGTFSAVE